MAITVLITGASSGIGAALAEYYAAQGAQLILVARRKERLEMQLQACLSLGANGVRLLVADVTAPDFAKSLGAELGSTPLSLAFVNAGFGVAGSIEKLGIQDFRRQLETNVFGAMETVFAALPALQRGRGRLVLIGSMNSYMARWRSRSIASWKTYPFH
jgi:short-subunit dehydrogenase